MGFFSKLFKGVTNLLGDVLGFLVGADFDDQSQAQGVLLNKSSNIANIPVIYGQRRVGGTRVFLSTGGNDNKYLYMALVLCEGEIEAIDDVYINDTISTDSKFSGLVSIQKFTGTDSQTYSTVLAGATDTWGANHRLRGVAYLAIRLQYDQDVFGSIPDIQCVVRGRKVYDPRTSTTAYSTNPALCLRDYLTNDRYGKGLASAQINDTAFSSAANVCDTTVTENSAPGSGTMKLLECNAVLDTNKTLFDNVKILLQGMRGLMPFQDGQYTLLIDSATTAGTLFRLDDSNITSEIQVTSSGKNKKYNRVRAKFVNPDANWQEDSVDWPPNDATYTTFLAEDNGEELMRDITLNTITNYYAARDIARIVCRASREHQLTVELTALPEALEIAVGDVVELEHDSLGWSGASIQEFRVLAMGLQENGEVKLTLQEYTNVYTWQEGPEEDDSPATTIPNPFSVEPPTALSLSTGTDEAKDGSEIPYLQIDFTAAEDAFVVEYIIRILPSGFEPSEVRLTTANLTSAQKDGTSAITYLVQPALVASYTVTVRAVNDAGVRSSAISGTISVTGDTTAPGAPTWASTATFGGVKSVGLAWTNPSDTDFAYTRIQRAPFGTTSWVTISNEYGRPGVADTFVDTGLADSQSYDYQIHAYDWSNNQSPSAGTRTGTTLSAPLTTNALEPRSAQGYLYLTSPTSSSTTSVSTPSASGYDWETGLFSSLTAGWSQDPPDVNPIGTSGAGLKYWSARYYVTENTYNGTEQVSISTPFNSFLFDGLVTFSNLNTELGDPASSLVTTIDGGLIKTGVVDLANATGMAVRQGKTSYSSTADGFWIGNDGGTAKVNVGDADNYLRWDGNDLVTSGIKVLDSNGEVLLDAGGGGLGIEGGSIIRNGAFRDESKTGAIYLTNTASAEIIDGWETADSSSGSGSTSYWGTQGVFQLASDHTIRTQNRFPVEFDETLYIAVNNFMPSGSTRAWSIQVQYQDANGNFVSQTDIPYNDARWGDTAPTAGARQISQAVVSVPNTNTIKTCRVRIRGGSGSSYVNIWNVYLGRSPSQITGKTIDTYIRDLSVDTLKIQDNAVTVPSTIQYGTSGYFSNATETVISGTTLAVNFGSNIPSKVICLALADLGSSGTGGDWAAAVLRLRYNTTNSTAISGSGVIQGVQVNSRKGAPPSLNLSTTVNGWSGTRYFFLTMLVTGETGSATGWWRNEDANISILGAKK